MRDLTTGQPLASDDPLVLTLGATLQVAGVPVLMVATGATVQVLADKGRLWFGRTALLGSGPVGLSWGPGDKVTLPALLQRMAAAERLAATLTAAAGEATTLNPSPVTVTADPAQSRLADLDAPGFGQNPMRECRRAMVGARRVAGFDLGSDPVLKQCDRVSFAVQGQVQGARDVNHIHIDSQYCAHAAHTRVEDTAEPAALGAPMVICSDCPDGVAAGDERLFVVVTEAEPNADQLNLEGLVETCETAPTRGAAPATAMEFLTKLGQRPDTRGAFGGLSLSGVWVDAYYRQVLPKSLALAKGD